MRMMNIRTWLRCGWVLVIAGCASSSSGQPVFQSSLVNVCVGTCSQPPLVPTDAHCLDSGPQYLADGAPTYCTYGRALNGVAAGVKACAQAAGVVQVTYKFDQQGMPRSIKAVGNCEHCELPKNVDSPALLSCVERAAGAARLPLGPNRQEFDVAFPYRVGEPLDPRLKPGYSPMEGTLY
jgi:hypothetical protein